MSISQRCQYALRALFELALQGGEEPVRIADIARAQDIPPRFLENILHQLKQGGFVESRRGKRGGYRLARPADSLSVGAVIRFVEGPIGLVECTGAPGASGCALDGRCVFLPMWRRATEALEEVVDSTSFGDLVDAERERSGRGNLDYTI